MKKAMKVSAIILGILFLIGGGIIGKMYMDEKKLNAEMLKVVKSEEAKEIFEQGLKNLDSKAFTDEGVIKSYRIDFDSIKHNPMGGINGELMVNNNKKLYVSFILVADSKGNLSKNQGISSYSSELETKIKEK